MPNTRTAPRKSTRRIARKRLRESGEQLAAVDGGGDADRHAVAAEIDSHDAKDIAYSMNEIEQYCEGCDRTISPMPCYRVTRRDGRQYCLECANRPLPTTADMVAIIARAFEIIAATARRGDEGSLDEQVAQYAQNELRPDVAGLGYGKWQELTRIWEHLAYRPRVAV